MIFPRSGASGVLLIHTEGDHVFYVNADAGAGFRLAVNNFILIDNWDNPDPNAVELSGTNFLLTGQSYEILLEYKEFTGEARVRLAWQEPGTVKTNIARSQLKGPGGGVGPTGVSVDSLGNIWAANRFSDNAVRINPNAGKIVVTNGVTNYVGEVDLVVGLGANAVPYNYSDMTGFNNRIVNPEFAPLKGYWTVIEDSGQTQVWRKVSWNAFLTNGCAVEVFVRASDDRQALVNAEFMAVTNHVTFSGVNGRYIEVRVAMIRPAASAQPLLYDLTLHGESSALDGFLDDAIEFETDEAWFFADAVGAGPFTYQCYLQYPWAKGVIKSG